jgi:hypothetical protein
MMEQLETGNIGIGNNSTLATFPHHGGDAQEEHCCGGDDFGIMFAQASNIKGTL